VRISHLRVLRDIYYIAVRWDLPGQRPRDVVLSDLTTPGRPWEESPPEMPYVDFPLEADRFFVLGDNSHEQGRAAVGARYWVPRKLLIGKALFITAHSGPASLF